MSTLYLLLVAKSTDTAQLQRENSSEKRGSTNTDGSCFTLFKDTAAWLRSYCNSLARQTCLHAGAQTDTGMVVQCLDTVEIDTFSCCWQFLDRLWLFIHRVWWI